VLAGSARALLARRTVTDTPRELLDLIRSASDQANGPYLTYARFRQLTGVPMNRVHQHFDCWTEACEAAGVRPGRASPGNITPNFSKGKEHALQEVKRVAASLGVSALSRRQFDSHNPEVKACTVARLWGGWRNALQAAGLGVHPNYHEEISLDELAAEFLEVLDELGRIPTLNQLVRRSGHCKNTFTRKFGSYTDFKKRAISHLLDEPYVPKQTRGLIEDHLRCIRSRSRSPCPAPVAPHQKGRHLGFRAFAFAPTYEVEVVSLFTSVAEDLGFEVVSQRPAFPDCEARRLTNPRRRRYERCLIEFELMSSDYEKHGHPKKGCDLIVCWKHDWKDCPIEVLELSKEIRKLQGWK